MTAGLGVAFLEFGDRWALFNEGRQALAELNETARFIWQGLAQREAPAAVVEFLVSAGASYAEASAYVDEALQAWLRDGWMIPADVAAQLDQAPTARVELSILEVGFHIDLFGAAPRGLLDILAPLRGGGAPRHHLSIVAWHDQHLLFVDRRPNGLFASDEIAPAVKAALTNRLVTAVTDGFVAHGALLERASRRLFLSGGPGAGKSTLALALRHAGFDCLSDDIIQVHPSGGMKGAPFAPALKAGAWPLLAGRVEGLEHLPTHRRADGQDVRYAPDVLTARGARPLDMFIALERQADGPAVLEPLSGLEAMRSLLDGAFSAAGQISAAQVKSLAAAFAATDCYVLRYADLDEAVNRLTGLADA